MQRNDEPIAIRLERIFLRVTTTTDREMIKSALGIGVTSFVMWRTLPKNILIPGVGFLTLLLIYFIM